MNKLSITQHYHIELDTDCDELACQIEKLVQQFDDHEIMVDIEFFNSACDSSGYLVDDTNSKRGRIDHSKIVSLYKAGWIARKIALELHTTQAVVIKHLQHEGIYKPVNRENFL